MRFTEQMLIDMGCSSNDGGKTWQKTSAPLQNTTVHPQPKKHRLKSGKRSDLDGVFFRSGWEANWARYLNWAVKHKAIPGLVRWEYEPDEYEFHTIKRGTRHYIPDFKLFFEDGSFIYHEVKGYMDSKSKTKLNRMAKFYPDIVVELVEKKRYTAVAKTVKHLIKTWE